MLLRWCYDGELKDSGKLLPVVLVGVLAYRLPHSGLKLSSFVCRPGDLQILSKHVVIPKLMLVVFDHESG